MEKVKIKINGYTYIVDVASTEAEKTLGLQNRDSLPSNRGMIFCYDHEEVCMWMKDTSIPLDLIFIDEDSLVKAVHQGIPYSEELMEETNVCHVLELNQDSGVQVGDYVNLKDLRELYEEEDDSEYSEEDYEDEVEMDEDYKSSMLVLDETGKIQMELEGGERIFSRKNTKTLIGMAKRAYKSKSESDFKRLGRKVFNYLNTQDGNDPDYVEIKNP